MKVAILCGGQGTRLKEHTEYIPKPLVEIGDHPILWHIMKIYSHFGITDFVLCLGYKGHKIREYFKTRTPWRPLGTLPPCLPDGDPTERIEVEQGSLRWQITFVDTGAETQTGGRIHAIKPYIEDETFCVTYGDGVANVDIDALIAFHLAHERTATLTSVQPLSQYGILRLGDADCIERFEEKPRMTEWINGGYFVFNRSIFGYLHPDDILERGPFEQLAADRQIVAFRHTGFWECMDTYKDTLSLNALWRTNQASWKMWDEIAV